jgi:hypothetical protein
MGIVESFDSRFKEFFKAFYASNKPYMDETSLSSDIKLKGVVFAPNEILILRPFMIQQGLIFNSPQGYALTDLGKGWAQQMLDEDLRKSFNPPFENIEKCVNELIPKLPKYGTFTSDFSAYDRFMVINALIPDYQEEARRIAEKSNEHFLKRAAFEYMTYEGFIENRQDIGNGYMQLTDKGRILKELGSLNTFILDEKNKEIEAYHRKKRDENLYWINFWIALGAIISGIYYSLEIFLEIAKRRRVVVDLNLMVCGFVFLAGSIAALIAILIAQEVLKRKK